MNLDLPLIFAALMGTAILAYVVLDGYDLGVGMLMPAANAAEQDVMVASIGPFWDANETWLVLGVGLMLVAFPAAHGIVLGALYLPVAAMLIGLMLRGVAFELRMKAEGWHAELWNWLFWFGSFLASLAQGFMLGRYITGFEPGLGYCAVRAGRGGWPLRWLRAARRDLADAAHRGRAAAKSARRGRSGACCGWRWAWRWCPWRRRWRATTVRDKWFDFPRTLWLMLLPLASVAAGIWVWRSLRPGVADWKPFAGAVTIYVLAFLGLAYSIFPYVVVDRMTIWDAASHDSALTVHAVGRGDRVAVYRRIHGVFLSRVSRQGAGGVV